MILIDKLIKFFKDYLWPKNETVVRVKSRPSVKGLYGWMIPLEPEPPRGLSRWKIVIGIYVSQSCSEEFEVQLSHLNIEKYLPAPERIRATDTHVIHIVRKKLSGINKRVTSKYLVVLSYMDGSTGRPEPNLIMKRVTENLCYDIINTGDGITIPGMERSVRKALVKWLGSDGSITFVDVQNQPTTMSTEV